MRIRSFDPTSTARLSFLRQTYEQFCKERGIPQEELDALEIHFIPDFTVKQYTVAEFQGRQTVHIIRLCTKDKSQRMYNTTALNKFLFHEPFHFLHFIVHGR